MLRRDRPHNPAPDHNANNEPNPDEKLLYRELHKNIAEVKQTFGKSDDLTIRTFRIGVTRPIEAAICCLSGMVNQQKVDELLETLMLETRHSELEVSETEEGKRIDLLRKYSIPDALTTEFYDFDSLFRNILSGNTVLLFDGFSSGYFVGTKGWHDRGVNEPSTQTVVRGPREGFSEPLHINISLIRRKIKDVRLRVEKMVIGEVTNTDVAIVYIEGLADPDILQELRQRLDRIEIDGILESGYIEELIQDSTVSPFPTVYNTERPDTVAGNLLEGRIAILVDGTPFVLLIPAIFVQFFQASEDYYHRFDFGLIRSLRLISFLLGLLLPAFYIAITTFHQEMIPTLLLISLAAQVEGIPFPAFFEALIMEVTFEILREAGIRMPRAVGSAISIVGALVLGDAAVNAGLVSPAMVIVVSLTAISNFVTPSFNMSISIRILRFGFMILAATFGLLGITLGVIAVVLHLCQLSSFGVPYTTPLSPFVMKDNKDTLFRFPIWGMYSRPRYVGRSSSIRENNPAPPKHPPSKKQPKS